MIKIKKTEKKPIKTKTVGARLLPEKYKEFEQLCKKVGTTKALAIESMIEQWIEESKAVSNE